MLKPKDQIFVAVFERNGTNTTLSTTTPNQPPLVDPKPRDFLEPWTLYMTTMTAYELSLKNTNKRLKSAMKVK